MATVCAIAYVCGVALFALHVSQSAFALHFTVPNRDDWRILDGMFTAPMSDWLFDDQNGHRIPVTLGLLYADYALFGGHQHLLTVGAIACMWLGIAALCAFLLSSDEPRGASGLAAAGFGAFLLSWAAARHDLVWGIHQGTLMALLFAIASAGSFGVFVERRAAGRSDARPLALASLFAAAATFSWGAGFSCWGGLLVGAVLYRVRARMVLAVLCGALATFALYRTGLDPGKNVALGTYAERLLTLPMKLAEIALAFVGAPIAEGLAALRTDGGAAPSDTAAWIGVAAVAVWLVFAARACTGDARPTRRRAVALVLPAVSLCGGAMLALNRTFMPEAAVQARFATWSTLFFIGLAAAIPPAIRSAAGGAAVALGLAVATGLALPVLSSERQTQADRRDHLAVVALLHLLDIRWDHAARGTTLGASADRSYRVVARFRDDHRAIFASALAELPGEVLADRVDLPAPGRCRGRVTSVDRIDTRGGRALRISGWAVDAEERRPLDAFAVTDEDGIVVGLGRTVARTADVLGAALPEEDFPWTGFVAGARGPYTVFGLPDGPDGPACAIGRIGKRSR